MQLFNSNVGQMFWAIIAIPGTLLLMVALTHVFQRKFKETTKLFWILVILVPIIGPLLYFVVGNPQHAQKNSR
jgi:Na+/melibiose symporter-like transporter